MRAGTLDRRIELLRPVKSIDDDTGESVVTYVPDRSVRAQRLSIRGTEGFSGVERFAEVTDRFRVHYLDGRKVTPEWAIRYDERTYDIVEAREIGRREVIEFLATARAE